MNDHSLPSKSIALRDNAEHVRQLCSLLSLGEVTTALEPVSGGFHHRVWRLDTTTGRYAVKQLADDMDVRNPLTSIRINATEAVGQAFADRGIPALASLSSGEHHLHAIDDQGYLVFPWTEHCARGKKEIGHYHATTVADIIARMHCADIRAPGLEEPPHWPLTTERVDALLQLAKKRNARDAVYIAKREEDILSVVEQQATAHATLAQEQVISHGDLDHKNVLWNDANEPLLIDWESARPINPTYETLLEALDWSGITANFETGPFEAFLQAYVKGGGRLINTMIPAAFDAILGAWVNWLLFNVGRAAGVEDLRLRALGSEQTDLAVGALLRLERNIPRLSDIAARYAT